MIGLQKEAARTKVHGRKKRLAIGTPACLVVVVKGQALYGTMAVLTRIARSMMDGGSIMILMMKCPLVLAPLAARLVPGLLRQLLR
jgi:hypothetical protein